MFTRPARQSPLAVSLALAHAVARTQQLPEIFDAALDAVAAGLGVRRASVRIFDPDGVMRFHAWRDLSDQFLTTVESHSAWSRGATNATPLVVADASAPSADPSLGDWVNALRAERIAALASVPLEGSAGVIGQLTVYYDEPHPASPDELELAALIAAQVALAVERSRDTRASQRLAAIVESSHDAIVSKDLNGIIASWNRGAEQMFGYTAAEAVGRSITLILPRDRLAEETLVLSRIRQGLSVEMETIRRRKDGSDIPISLTVSPVKDSAGHIVGASKIARDISERKQSEAERSELVRRLTMLVAASASLLEVPEADSVRSATVSLARQLLVADAYAVWMSDHQHPEWHIVAAEGVSDAFAHRVLASHVGVPIAKLISGPLAVSDVTSQPLLEDQLAAYTAEGIHSMLVCPMQLGGGRSATLVFYYRTPRQFSDIDVQTAYALANMAAAAMTAADLTDQLRRERNAAEASTRQAAFLAEATALLSQSLEYEETLSAVARLAVPEFADWCAVDIVNEAGRLQRLAVAHVDPRKVAHARELEERYPADPSTPGGVHQVIRTGQPVMMHTIPRDLLMASARDEEHRRLIDELALTSYMCVPLMGRGGTSGAMTLVFAESGRHYTERDLAFARSLASRAALAIENALAYRRANEANRVKDEFLATLSHELRTPLNAILGYAQMLTLGLLDGPRTANAVAILTRNAQSLKQIIDDVLDVARITSGKLRMNVRPVALEEIARNAVATLEPAAHARGISLTIVADSHIPAVAGDADRLQQVVWNLLSNAVKFTPRGGHVQLRLERVESSVQIVVSDDGQGIDEAFLPHVFERFRQADSRFARRHGGLGLGLAIVRELVELHGGTVSASSDGPGTGATFEVRLPAMIVHGEPVEHHDAGPRAPAASFLPATLPLRLQGVRILAVDDEEDAIGLLRTVLQSAGAEVTTAGSAERALELLAAEDGFDLMVADIGMPEVDGLELIRRVRQELRAPANRIPAVALTAYARSEDRVTTLAGGFQMHLPKPVEPIELVIALAALIGR